MTWNTAGSIPLDNTTHREGVEQMKKEQEREKGKE